MAEAPRGRGRPTLLTPELANKILKAVGQGFPIELAAELNLVSRATVLEWVRRGEGRDEERPADDALVDFANRYRQSRAKFYGFLMQPCVEAVAGVRPKKVDSGKTDKDGKPIMVKAYGAFGRAGEAKWHLSRRFPEFCGSGRESAGVAEALAELQEGTPAEKAPVINITLAEDPDAPSDTASADATEPTEPT